VSSSTHSTESTSGGITQISKLGPIVSVRDGLQPISYLYDKSTTLGDDGWVYVWEERVSPWFVSLGRNYHGEDFNNGIYRRDKLDLVRIERLRWAARQHLVKVVERYSKAKKALRKLKHPYFMEDNQKILLNVRGTGGDFEVNEKKVEIPATIVEQIAMLPLEDDPDYLGGTEYHRLKLWCSAWWDKIARLDKLLAVCGDDLIRRTVGPTLSRDRWGSPRVVLQINGRPYQFNGPGQANGPHSHWPQLDDVVIDVNTIKKPRNKFHQAGREFDAPHKKPKRRSKRAAS
jgi:hypothetical protein